MFNKKDNALVQFVDASQAQLGMNHNSITTRHTINIQTNLTPHSPEQPGQGGIVGESNEGGAVKTHHGADAQRRTTCVFHFNFISIANNLSL